MVDFSDPLSPWERPGFYMPGKTVHDVAVGKPDCVYIAMPGQVIDLCKGNIPEPGESLLATPAPTP